MNKVTLGKPISISQVRALNSVAGYCWFSASTLRFFAGKVYSSVVTMPDCWLFISSEQFTSSSGRPDPRKYTIRSISIDGDVDTVGEFGQYRSKEAALAEARRLAKQANAQAQIDVTFKWTTSRAVDTYGYNICTLYANGKRGASCSGGGYDMKGTALGLFMMKQFDEQLRTLTPSEFYGLTFYAAKTETEQYKRIDAWQDGASLYLDGACGFSSVMSILRAIGYDLIYLGEDKRSDSYALVTLDEAKTRRAAALDSEEAS